MAGKKDALQGDLAGNEQELQGEFGYPGEDEDGLYGWKFHKGPLIAAVVLTVIFYIFVFLWVD